MHHTFKAGDRVVCKYQSKYREYDLDGRKGTIGHAYYASKEIPVYFDDVVNEHSGKGCFYLDPCYLEVYNDESKRIKEETTMENITNYLNIAKIRFLDTSSSRTYEYANFDPALRPRDLCVAEGTNGKWLAVVEDIVPRNDVNLQREVVARVDTTAYDERVANRKKAAEIKAKMQERAKQLQDIALYQMLAKDDPAMLELLNEYQAIPKN